MRVLLVVFGLPGAGKTAVARVVATAVGAVHLEIDQFWTRAYRLPDYSIEQSNRVFRDLLLDLTEACEHGSRIVVDGVFASRSRLNCLDEIAAKHGYVVRHYLLHCSADIALERILARSKLGSNEGRPAIDCKSRSALSARMDSAGAADLRFDSGAGSPQVIADAILKDITEVQQSIL